MNLLASCFCRTSAMRILAVSSFAFVFAGSANTQWIVVNLHPAGATESNADAIRGGQQIGTARFLGINRATLWTGSSASYTDLTPPGVTRTTVYGVGGGQQAGTADINLTIHACLWNSSASSWVDLHPAEMMQSLAYDTNGVQQVGSTKFQSQNGHACIWSGTAGSRVDLHPIGSAESVCFGIGDGQQVGTANIGGATHASLWSGTPGSWVDLHPLVSTRSYAFETRGGQQVGHSRISGAEHASLWSGTSSSFVDLHPVEASESYAADLCDGQQVGTVNIGGYRASLWFSTAGSRMDLHSFLPPEFSRSVAAGIDRLDGNTTIVGYGFNSLTGRNEALMWIRPISVVQPSSYAILQGLNFGGNLAALFNSDNDKVYVLCDEFDSNGEIQFGSSLPAGTVSQLKFKFEGSASRNDLSQFVRMFNYSTNAYTNVSFQNSTIVDSVVEGTITTGVANYFSGTREVRSRVFWVPQADISNVDGWTQTCDQALWTMN